MMCVRSRPLRDELRKCLCSGEEGTREGERKVRVMHDENSWSLVRKAKESWLVN
jgi:hypothetical protein